MARGRIFFTFDDGENVPSPERQSALYKLAHEYLYAWVAGHGEHLANADALSMLTIKPFDPTHHETLDLFKALSQDKSEAIDYFRKTQDKLREFSGIKSLTLWLALTDGVPRGF